MKRLSIKIGSLLLFALLGFSTSASAALVDYFGVDNVVGSDGVSRYVQVCMTFDDQFVKNPGTPPPVPGGFRDGPFGHFKIVSTTVHVSGLGALPDINGRLKFGTTARPRRSLITPRSSRFSKITA